MRNVACRQAECHPDRKHHCRGLCRYCYNKQWKRDHPERAAEYYRRHRQEWRRYMLVSKWGMSPAEYDEMLEAQGGVCAICKGSEKDGRYLSVDHDHNSGKVRGLLCQRCNVLVGMAGDSPTVLTSAIRYLGGEA